MSERKQPTKYTDAKAIRAWVLREQGQTNEQIGEKLDISGRSVTLWIRKVDETPKLKAQAKKKLEKKPRRSGNGVEEISELMTENAYLRWWNLGLKEGFVDRLLKDMDMK